MVVQWHHRPEEISMAIFDQRGQPVVHQYNAARDIHVSVRQREEPCVVVEPARSGPYASYGRQLGGLTMQNVGGALAFNISIGTRPDADVIPTLASGDREFIRVPPPMEAFREHVLRKVGGEYQLALDPDSAEMSVILTIEFEDFAQQRYFVREKITPQSHEIIARGTL
jgi:hypothetical protein